MAGHMADTEPSKESMERQHKYEVEDAVRSLTKAEEIKKDKKLYGEACEMMKKQKMMMDSAMGQGQMNKEEY